MAKELTKGELVKWMEKAERTMKALDTRLKALEGKNEAKGGKAPAPEEPDDDFLS